MNKELYDIKRARLVNELHELEHQRDALDGDKSGETILKICIAKEKILFLDEVFNDYFELEKEYSRYGTYLFNIKKILNLKNK